MTSVIVLAARDAIAHHLQKIPNVRVLVVDDPPALKLGCVDCKDSEHLIPITPKLLGNLDKLARVAKREVDRWLPNHLHQDAPNPTRENTRGPAAGRAPAAGPVEGEQATSAAREGEEAGLDRTRPGPASDPVLRALVRHYGPAGALARREQLRHVVAGVEERLLAEAPDWRTFRTRVGLVLAGALVEEQLVAKVSGGAA